MSATVPHKLFLLDAMALIYRAHFAFSKNPRITSKGLNTSAILGFTNTLVEILTKEKPSHIIVAFDTPFLTHRHKIFPAYKEHRPTQPENITGAIPYIKKILEAFGIPALSLEGYEADDVIGTLAVQAAAQDFIVYIMSPDKDFAQLVKDYIYLYKPAFMGNEVTILDKKAVLDKWQITNVDQIRDLLALQGDAVDNIPGIPTIGAKTAQKLIEQFGTIENLIANAENLSGKLKENVIQYAQQGILSKELATIHTEVPLQFDIAKSLYQGPDANKLRPIFQELEFNTLTRRVLGDSSYSSSKKESTTQNSLFDTAYNTGAKAEELIKDADYKVPAIRNNIYTTKHQYHLIDTPTLRKELIYYLQLQDTFCFDTETTSLDPYQAQLVGISFSYYKGEAYYVPMPSNQEVVKSILEEFRPLLESTTHCKVGQNIKYDNLVLRCYGIAVAPPIFDTMVAHYLVAPDRPHNMNAIAESYLNYSPIPIEALIGSKKSTQKNMRMVDIEVAKEYACEDADITLQLKQLLEEDIEKQQLEKLFYTIENLLVEVLTAMEYQGVQVDVPILEKISTNLGKELEILETKIYQLAGTTFNLNSPKQLGEILFEKLKITEKPKKTKSGQYATNELILADFTHTHPIINEILSYRELQKLKSTYVDALPSLVSPFDGRIHTSYNQTVVVTGRLSSNNPNLQNIPIRTEKSKAIREAFIPSKSENMILSADYSQIELRIMASFSQDETMIEVFRANKDIHTATASKLFKVPLEEVDEHMRRRAKTANFGIIYGISAFGLAQRLSISRLEANSIITAYFQEFPAVKLYMDSIMQQGREQGYVTTLMGRRKYLRDINSRNATLRGFDERNAINAPIQGTAAEMIKLAMVHIYDWLQKEKLASKLILQVHDELVFDTPVTEVDLLREKVIYFMKNALPLAVPVEVQVGTGKNWSEAH